MRNSKLYSILVKFDRYRQNRLRKFLMSPYFNRSEAIVKLYEFYITQVNTEVDDKGSKSSKEAFWNSVHTNKPFSDVRFRKYQSDLLKLVNNFLIQEKFSEDNIQQQQYLVDAVLSNQLEKLYDSSIRTLELLTENSKHKSSHYFYNKYRLNIKHYDIGEVRQDRKRKRPVEKIIENIDIFALGEKLRYTCLALSHKSIYNHDYELPDLTNSIKNYKHTPSLVVYQQMYLTQIESENEKHYFTLRSLLKQHGQIFPLDEAEFIYFSAINYCIKKVNQGFLEFRLELFKLYQDLLEKNILTATGTLSPWHFRNAITIALRLGDTNWVEKFISQYGPILPDKFRDNAVSFNLSQLYLYQKKYEDVIKLLQSVEYEDFTYNLNAKATLLTTYYEIEEIEALYSLMDSFRTFLNRHKDFTASRRSLYSNLIKYTKKLTRIKDGDKSTLQKLKDEVDQVKGIASEKWLKEKIAERLAKAK